MASGAAAEGDVVVEITCRCGSVWVRSTAVRAWQCRCLRKSVGEKRTLGPKGAL